MENFGAIFGKLIGSPVGNNLENNEEDVRRVKGTVDVAEAYKNYEELKEKNLNMIEELEKEILSISSDIREIHKQRDEIVEEMHYSGCFKR